ncbi:MAG TPA: shikimate kinase [Bryobacteraceae bacterium]|nr:shikimate kinase [Bryobacteraceae bacterium]
MILKLKNTPGIYLAGFMASGKSTIGRLLADRLGWHFVDLDEEIEAAAGMRIFEIFETGGEAEFRRVERDTMRERVGAIERGRPTVMALGGGAIVAPENFAMIEDNGITIWLDCPFETVCRRVGETSHRPLARDPDTFARLYEERRASYARADFRIPVESDDPAIAVEAILHLPLFR